MCLHYWLFSPLNRGSYDRFFHVLLCIFEFPRFSLLRDFLHGWKTSWISTAHCFCNDIWRTIRDEKILKFWPLSSKWLLHHAPLLGNCFPARKLPRSNLYAISPHFMIIDEFKITLPGSNYKFVFKNSSISSFTCEWKWRDLIWATSVPIEFIACDFLY